MLAFTPLPLESSFHSLPVTVVGSPANHVITRGWLNPVNNALADKDLFVVVSAFSTPNATMKAAFGSTPVGSNTFNLVTGKDAEGQPKWGEVVLDDGVTPIGTADLKFEAALVDDSDVTALDAARFNFATEVTPVFPTQPVFTSSAACLKIDGTQVAGLEDVTVTMISDLGRVDGGSCRAAPTAHRRLGRSTCVVEATVVWTTNRQDVNLQDDPEIVIEIEARSDVLVDPGGAAGTQFNFLLEFFVTRFSDGSSFKVLSSATDDNQSLSFACEPTDSTPQWRLTVPTDFQDMLA